MIIDKTGSLKEQWVENSRVNQPVLEKHGAVLSRVSTAYMKSPIMIAGGGASLLLIPNPLYRFPVIANQSSAPYIAYSQYPVDFTVMIDGGIAVLDRIKYMVEKKVETTYIVATHIHPKVLKAIVKTGNPIEFFIHHSTEDQDLTDKLMGHWDNYPKGIPCIAQMGSVVNASVAISALKFPKVPMVFSGVDFGYPVEYRDRVPTIKRDALGRWVSDVESEPGPKISMFGYPTSPQHAEYYQQFRMLIDHLKKDHKFYVTRANILHKDLGFDLI